jgi:hypothetical protein
MTKLTRVLVLAGLALALPAMALKQHVDNPAQAAMAAAVARLSKACGYSLGGLEEADSDAANNAHNACVAAGCTGANVQVSYLPWQTPDGFYHVCVGYTCTGCLVVAVGDTPIAVGES